MLESNRKMADAFCRLVGFICATTRPYDERTDAEKYAAIVEFAKEEWSKFEQDPEFFAQVPRD